MAHVSPMIKIHFKHYGDEHLEQIIRYVYHLRLLDGVLMQVPLKGLPSLIRERVQWVHALQAWALSGRCFNVKRLDFRVDCLPQDAREWKTWGIRGSAAA